MTEKKNRIALRVLMARHDLSATDVANALGIKSGTVRNYVARKGIDCPDSSLSKLKQRYEAPLR